MHSQWAADTAQMPKSGNKNDSSEYSFIKRNKTLNVFISHDIK